MPFTPEMSVKVQLFDQEHKRLIDLTESLYAALKEDKGRISVAKLLEELEHYTKSHFVNEEDLMQKYSYSGYDKQKRQHDEFISKVAELKQSYNEGNSKVPSQAFDILYAWISHHILKVDAEYGEFFNKRGIR
ncbi:MAG: bacteriohemerythrin [Deferribacteraceae bacterium]|jgi:hemerythrin|nr:bacteriohemerythrin [Deferribacteraceae bacterium]